MALWAAHGARDVTVTCPHFNLEWKAPVQWMRGSGDLGWERQCSLVGESAGAGTRLLVQG